MRPPIFAFVAVVVAAAPLARGQVLPLGYPCEVLGVSRPVNVSACSVSPECSGAATAKFRTIDGTCNNLARNTKWGSAGETFARLVSRNPLVVMGYPPEFYYRNSGRKLPNARAVSSAIHGGTDRPFRRVTTMVMQFGQFLDHDLTLTPEMNLCREKCPAAEMEIDCCLFVGKGQVPKSCYPIAVPDDDHDFHSRDPAAPRCLDLKRSQPAVCNYTEGEEHTREQFNVLTAFVDGSQIYGSDDILARSLRSFSSGMLRLNDVKTDQNMMPFAESACPATDDDNAGSSSGEDQSSKHKPFVSGDSRVNENPGLQAMHTIWFREHNRLAALIAAQDPALKDEQIYQEARRLVGAELQQIVYADFLPIVVGPKFVRDFRLDSVGAGAKSLYKADVDPNIFNAFAAAAFRFGHSLVSSLVSMMKSDLTNSPFNLTNHFFDTSLVCNGKLAELVTGMCFQGAERMNNIMTDGLRNRLFPHSKKDKFGSDLAARNIMRGRDHELASYDSYRVSCGLKPLPNSFYNGNEPRPAEFTPAMWDKFAIVYSSPKDIEIFPGGMSETPVAGGLVGPTFACLLSEQFARVMHGDRYFFTHANVPREIRLCDGELAQLRKRTIRDVICDNADDVTGLPLNPFTHDRDAGEDIVSCAQRNELRPEVGCQASANSFDAHGDGETPGSNEDEDSGYVAMLAGGHDGWDILDSVELYSPNNTCQHNLAPLPVKVYGLVLAYVDPLRCVMACGGRTANGLVDKTCWRLDFDQNKENPFGQWVEMTDSPTKEVRWLAAQSSIKGTVFVTGGWASPSTSEIFDPKTRQWMAGPPLTGLRKQHCMVTYGDAFIVLGGTTSGDRVEVYNATTRKWTTLPETLAFRDTHDCILLPNGEDILIFGGTIFSSVYNIPSGRSYYGIDNILSRDHARAVELQGRVFILGGSSLSNRVEEFDTKLLDFILVRAARLKEARTRFGVARVPAGLFKHLPGGCKP